MVRDEGGEGAADELVVAGREHVAQAGVVVEGELRLLGHHNRGSRTQEAFSTPLPADAVAQPDQDALHSAWGLCSALVGQLALTLPIDPVTGRPVGFAGGGEMTLDALADATRALTARVIAQSGSPFVWHRDRRHAPSRSRMCARTDASGTPHAPGRVVVGGVEIGTPNGGRFTVQKDAQESFPFFGFLAQSVGDAGLLCVCATPHPQDSTRCVVDASTCATLSNTTGPPELLAACARPARAYTQATAAGGILQALRQPENAGVRCPELGPSDLLWGLAPVGASGGDESAQARAWGGTGTSGATYEGARFLHEPRAGLRLSNYGHVNATYHQQGIDYAGTDSAAADHALPRCLAPEELVASDATVADFAAANETELLLRHLFPATQLLSDSPLVAVCTRYLVEVARATALATTAQARTAALQAAAWRRRCGAKVREGAACAHAGLLFDTPPPPFSPAAACRSVSVASLVATATQQAAVVGGGAAVYVTPQAHGCVVVDRAARRFFDGPLCAHLALRRDGVLTNWASDLAAECELTPFDALLTSGAASYTLLFGRGGARLSLDWLANLAPAFTLDVLAKDDAARRVPARDRVSHVYDWWPDDTAVLGLHVTASPHVADEFAPILFDSHYAFDASAATAFYVHSLLRNASLLPNTLGAGGVCRAPNVGLGLWDANTNRVCTRLSRVPSAPADPGPAPIAPPAVTDAAYFPEQCAPTHDAVPYDARGRGAAGDIPGWRTLTTLSTDGETLYAYGEYPPMRAGTSDADDHPDLFAELFPSEEGWTDACALRWSAPTPCVPGAACPLPGDVCLAVANGTRLSATAGVCVSAAIAQRVDPTRTPCFVSAHCPGDSDVCLADGACAPLHMHVWNRFEHTWDMEVAVLADDCGFPDAVHPYTQSTRGASPWEIVPDLFHMHGFCGHRHWFAYRTALATLPLADGVPPNTTQWPWIQTRFDGKPSKKPFQTLDDGEALRAVPHPCDQAFMHLQAPATSQRLRVCAGVGGHADRALATYALSGNTWAGVAAVPAPADTPQTSRWLRTYDEATDALHVGAVNRGDGDDDVPLGFLGADASASDVRAEMASDDESEFFRCTDHMGCSNPHHTYNGVTVDRLDPRTLRGNYSELSLRLCGAIGYVGEEWPNALAGGGACWLDIALFPLLVQLLMPADQGGAVGCAQLWARGAALDWVVVVDDPTAVALAVLQGSPRTLFCATGSLVDAPACAYAARASPQLAAASASDAVMGVTQSLNGLWHGAGAAITGAALSKTRAYAHINRCAAQLLENNARLQAERQAAYDTPAPSGVYFALRVVLYEVPIPWLHHAMLLTLLHSVDATVTAPDWSQIGAVASMPDLFLWADGDRGPLCRDDAELDVRPVLWRLLCRNAHPGYTFEDPDADLGLIDTLEGRVLKDVLTELPTTAASVLGVQCFTAAEWTCGQQSAVADVQACYDALMTAYNDTLVEGGGTVCERAAGAVPSPEWFDPCHHPEHFRLSEPTNLTLEELDVLAGGMPNGGLANYLESLRQATLQVVDQVAASVDYAGGGTWTDTVSAAGEVPVVRVRPLSAFMASLSAAQGGFNLSNWLHHGVCLDTYIASSACSSQYDTTDADPCMWSSGEPDLERYATVSADTEPSITLHYGGGIAPDVIPLCDLPDIATEAGACLVQYQDQFDTIQHPTVCNIQRVEAPAGVEVQGYATDMSAASWANTSAGGLCSTATPRVRSCTWNVYDEGAPRRSAWWSFNNTFGGPSLRADLDGLQPLDQDDFYAMGTWLPDIATDWKSEGCGLFGGLCAVRVRLAPVTSGVGAGVCMLNRDPRSYAHTTPDCPSLMRDAASAAFVTWRGPTTSLYRCGPCTRYHRTITANPEARFRCSLTMGQDSDDVLGAVDAATAYLTRPLDLPDWTSTPTRAYQDLTTAPAVYTPLARALEQWRRRNTDAAGASSCDSVRTPAACFENPGATLLYAITDDDAVWSKAVDNPNVRFTMICQTQVYGEDQAARCDAAGDARRQRLADFVDRQYRQTDGVWLPAIPPNQGAAWVSYAASARTGVFSLMYASADRSEADVRARWLLGSTVCGIGESTRLDQRLCVRSRVRGDVPFIALHPWLGGDFSPFDGLDVCGGTALCACACAPDEFCGGDNRTLTPAQLARRAREFPALPACLRQAYASTSAMDADDASNLCAQAQKPVPASTQCLQPQGLFADGAPSRTVSRDELHGAGGVATTPADFLVQDMYAASGSGNGLWAGRTLQQERITGLERYAFLRMDRMRMHPAHIAFVHSDGTGAPLVVAQVALRTQMPGVMLPQAWPLARDAETAADAQWLAGGLYGGGRSVAGDWTCPLRAAAFWGGNSTAFAPVVPSPTRAAVLFPGLGGAHPLVRSRTARDALVAYVTTQGACFYERGRALDGVAVDIADPMHPCGLQGILRALQTGGWVPSQIMSVQPPCATRIDVPDVSATLRSSEPLDGIASAPCAALPRLTPFVLRTRGDQGRITPRAGLTTRSEGGDCHMGRALRYAYADRIDIAGRMGCALTRKTAVDAEATCADGTTAFPLARARPLTLPQLIAKTAVTYRDAQGPALAFRGPGDTVLQEPESSVGQLFATSLQRAVATDLAQQCTPQAPWPGVGGAFWQALADAPETLFADNCTVAPASPRTAQLYARPNASETAASVDAYTRLWAADAGWAWARGTQGSVDRDAWEAHGTRFAACNASLQQFFASSPGDAATALMARPISLCEPAPTASLQAFCTAMLQYRTNVQNVNCELMGAGACLYEPGTFYVPYAWSASNQEFAADTVLGYYQDILLQPRFKATTAYARLCPQRSTYQQMLAQLSRAQAAQCPGYQMEYLKNLLDQFKGVGYIVIHMAYCTLMFCVNALGSVMSANDPFAADAMLTLAAYYVGEFIKDAEKVIMPILNAVITVLFGTSSFGKIMSTALGILCQVFNVFINDFVIPSWCAIIRPAVYVIFSALEHIVGLFSPSAGDGIHNVWVALSGGDGGIDPRTCLGSMVTKIQCDAGKFTPDDNASNYLPAPVATRCWADSSGGGPFSGYGDASYLACTGSDTCAQDPLLYDASAGTLIACAACPSAIDASNAFDPTARAYGCDAALKRCTCGAAARAPDSCLTSADCAQQTQAQCAVVSDLDHADAQASTSMPCTECGSLGMQPACVRNAQGGLGTCACAAVLAASTLQKCSLPGQRVPLLQATGFCLATADLSADLLSPSLTLDFGALAIAPCLWGLSDNGCVHVRLPLASSGAYATPLAVILAPAPPSASYTRRLLSASLVHVETQARFEAAARLCLARERTRDAQKACLHWHEAAQAAGAANASWGALWASARADPRRTVPTLLARGFDEGGLVWALAAAAFARWPAPAAATCAPTRKPRGRRLLQASVSTFSTLPTLVGSAIPWTLAPSASDCPVLDDAIATVGSAWVDTVAFYAQGFGGEDAPDAPTPLERAVNETLTNPLRVAHAGLLPSVANAVLLGYGDRIMDAIVTRDDTRLLSGRRLVQELSTCNYTELTFGTRASVNRGRGMTLLYIFAATFLAFSLFATCFIPQGFATHLAWFSLFPMLVFWAAYGVAPTCWPMVPPRFPHDLATEVGGLVPSSLEIPRFLVDARCDVRGHLLGGGEYDATCFKTCSEEPFLFKSWQDPAAWWLCELSTTLCAQAADSVQRWGFLGDFISSAAFFGEVVAFAAQDPDYTAAFRTCAFFASAELILSVAFAGFVVLFFPSLLVTVFEIFGAALVMLSQASASEAVMSAPDAA